MKVSLNLLRELGGLTQTTQELLELISSRIGEIDQVETLADKYRDIVVAEIIESNPHPDADKLSVNKVNIGHNQIIQVIAGDKTLKAGHKVAYIPPGNIVPVTAGKQNVKLEVRSIRGLDSHGMLASEHELDLSSAHTGVLKLDSGLKVGQAVADLYKLDDYIVDVETKVLTHRPDMFGHLGFARELAAAAGQPFTSPKWYLNRRPAWPKSTAKLDLALDNRLPKLVPRITIAAYDNVIIEPAPLMIQSWLMRLGIRPINNVVDLTNYMMIISGQPLHAFDYDKLAKGQKSAKVVVRYPKKGETLKLIDGSQVQPQADAIMIANNQRAIGLGGIMGGLDTEVDQNTKRVVIEAANFNMYSIRNNYMNLGINSEAVTRFARGQDPDAIAAVQAKTAEYLQDWAGANIAGPLLDEYPHPRSNRSVEANAKRINALLGVNETASSMARALGYAELKASTTKDKLKIDIPTWRPDLNIEADIVEEVGRLKGYSRITPQIPMRTIRPVELSSLKQLERQIKRTLSSAGANEILSYSGVPAELIENTGQDVARAYKIRNAISPDVQLMRLSLTPSLLDKVNPNVRRGFSRFALFEVGTVHNNRLLEDKLPQEQPATAMIIASGSGGQSSGATYFNARKYLDYLLGGLGLTFNLTTSLPADDPWLAQTSAPFAEDRRAFINIGKQIVGIIGEYNYRCTDFLRLPAASAGFEIHLERVLSTIGPAVDYQALSKYPAVYADITLRTTSQVSFSKLDQTLSKVSLKSIQFDYSPLEIFSPDKSHRHTTFKLEFVSHERTLTQKEVNKWLAQIVKSLAKRTGATQV